MCLVKLFFLLQNAAPNHRANDIIVLEDRPQILTARFMYGPLDMVSLSGERVQYYQCSFVLRQYNI